MYISVNLSPVSTVGREKAKGKEVKKGRRDTTIPTPKLLAQYPCELRSYWTILQRLIYANANAQKWVKCGSAERVGRPLIARVGTSVPGSSRPRVEGETLNPSSSR